MQFKRLVMASVCALAYREPRLRRRRRCLC